MNKNPLITRRSFLKVGGIGGLAVAAGSLWPTSVVAPVFGSGSLRPGAGRFRVIHYTDVHVQPELNGERGYAQCIAHMNGQAADFALSGGDLVFDVLRAGRERKTRLWDMYIRRKRDFVFPVHEVIGNHDNYGFSNKDLGNEEPGYGKKEFQERFERERTYTSFDYKGWRFVLLDSIKHIAGGWEPRLDDEQKAWLKDNLQKSKGIPKVVALHVPVVTYFTQLTAGPLEATKAGSVMNDAAELRELFEANDVKLVLQGHTHIRDQYEYNGVRYITSGAVSGSWWNGPRFGHPEGYATIDFHDGGFEWNYHTYGWKAKSAEALDEDDRRLLRGLYAEREIFALV